MVNTSNAMNKYTNIIMRLVSTTYPHLSPVDINNAIQYSINKRYKEEKTQIYNNYTKKEPVELTILELVEYIITREPILTASGVMFKKHDAAPNPLAKMIEKFMISRGILKKKMFEYPKGSEMFEYYNLLQTLAKIDANGLYGVLGLYNSFYFDLHVAKSITGNGRSLVSAAGMLFESFLANGVKFSSLNEIMTFLDNIVTEERHWNDAVILDRNIPLEESFFKVASSCGFQWIPDEEDLWLIYQYMSKLSQEDLNRIYYKNNLYEFISNTSMKNAIQNILSNMENPYLDPNIVPDEIKEELSTFSDILNEYVYYKYLYIDSIDKMSNMVKNVVSISDTDSDIISVNAWYSFVKKEIIEANNLDLKIMHKSIDMVETYNSTDDYGNMIKFPVVREIDPDLEYDFFNEEIIEMERTFNPVEIIPQDTLRYSIINIMGYCLGNIINDYMERFTKASNSYKEGKDCLIIMKNEFLFKSALLTHAKKNYATIQEIQEGNIIKNPGIDIKGLSIDKSGMNDKIRTELKRILFEDILNVEHVDQLRVISKLAILEDEIYKSLKSGNKEYYKPVTVKSINSYDDPMSIQGIKGSVVWNTIRDNDMEIINLDERNSLDILKLDINRTNIRNIKESHPEEYKKVISLIGDPDDLSDKGIERYKNVIEAIAIPKDAIIPEWLTHYIDYSTIVNDNLTNFPLESIGINKPGSGTINYSNILSF